MKKIWRAWICLLAASMLFVSACSSETETVPAADSVSEAAAEIAVSEKSAEQTDEQQSGVLESIPVETVSSSAETAANEEESLSAVSGSSDILSGNAAMTFSQMFGNAVPDTIKFL